MSATDLIEQALDNLVKQFANPMDFLRELVQNSIDAGSPRIEVALRYQPMDNLQGVAEIEVRDFGQGMDEDVIDSQLTRLFSSAKEGDRTAIGKFGIGFTSVFAIRPNAVRVITGKHGENWEVLFHEDRSFEKRRFLEAASGTTITIYKRMRLGKVPELVHNARASLVNWCEHAHTPIQFTDDTQGSSSNPATSTEPVDVFAVFEEASNGEIINQPFELDGAALQIDHERDGVRAVVGYTDLPNSWSFFSGGLTLHRSTDASHLARYQQQFQGLSFKILARTVGHTLTRDNVIQDANWEAAMDVALEAAVLLREKAVERMEQLAGATELDTLVEWHDRLVPDLAREPLDPERRVFVDPMGQPCSLSMITSRMGVLDDEIWMANERDERLSKALAEAEVASVRAHSATGRLLGESLGHTIRNAEGAFCVCDPLPRDGMSNQEFDLIAYASDLAGRATEGAFRLSLCDLGEHSPLLFVEGRSVSGLYRVPERAGVRGMARKNLKHWQTWLGKRRILVNRAHPHVVALLAYPDSELAAYALVEALVVEDAGFPRSTLHNLRATAVRRWVTYGS